MVRKLVRPSLKEVMEKMQEKEKQKVEKVKKVEVPSAYQPVESAMDGKKVPPPFRSYKEVEYYQKLIEEKTPLKVVLQDGKEIEGFLEYYDKKFIRITRKDEPNAFIFKWQIKYLYEIN